MEQKIREVVSEYINIPAEQISNDTIIDRLGVSSSIVLHRMYAKLAENGIKVDNYWNIKTFGNLLQQNSLAVSSISQQVEPQDTEASYSNFAIGIDIEEIEMMPVVNDFRENEFYKMNFAPSEISHCILQQNPYLSFAGLFSAKEAIIKSSNNYRNTEFKDIIIEHAASGKPLFKDFELSISHTGNVAVAVAVQHNQHFVSDERKVVPVQDEAAVEVKRGSNTWLLVLAVIISIAALLTAVLK